jgi:hypothetical protein
MGNANKSKKNSLEESEKFINEFFKNTGLEFTTKEMANFKLSISDTEKYFCTKFDYFLFFNNYVFRERLSLLYDNYNSKIEEVANKGSLSVLINFDHTEIGYLLQGSKPDFDPLLTIVLEKLEMGVLLYFNMTNLQVDYIHEFFTQMIESIDMYRYNRKFDCLYFLLPNTDYFVKNGTAVYYISNKNNGFNVRDKYLSKIFSTNLFENLVDCRYPKMEVNNFFYHFVESNTPVLIKIMLNFDFTNFEKFEFNNEEQINELVSLFGKCEYLHLLVDVKNINENDCSKIFFYLITKIITIHEFSEDTKLKLTLVSDHKKDKKCKHSFKKILYQLENYFSLKIFTIKKRDLLAELYYVTQDDQNIYTVTHEELDLMWGGNDTTYYTLYYLITKKQKFSRLNKEKIVTNLSKLLNMNYKLTFRKQKKIKIREEYIINMYN